MSDIDGINEEHAQSETPIRTLDDEDPQNRVEIQDRAKGIIYGIFRKYDLVKKEDDYTVTISSTPELAQPNPNYREEAEAKYNNAGQLTRLRTGVFIGRSYEEEDLAAFSDISPNAQAAFIVGDMTDKLLSDVVGEEQAGEVIDEFVKARMRYITDHQEPYVEFERGENGVWKVKLLPNEETHEAITPGEGWIQEVHDLGEIHENTQETVAVKWGNDTIHYGVDTSTGQVVIRTRFAAHMDQKIEPIMGIDTVRFMRSVAVPSAVDTKKLKALYNPRRRDHLSIAQWLPVDIHRII